MAASTSLLGPWNGLKSDHLHPHRNLWTLQLKHCSVCSDWLGKPPPLPLVYVHSWLFSSCALLDPGKSSCKLSATFSDAAESTRLSTSTYRAPLLLISLLSSLPVTQVTGTTAANSRVRVQHTLFVQLQLSTREPCNRSGSIAAVLTACRRHWTHRMQALHMGGSTVQRQI